MLKYVLVLLGFLLISCAHQNKKSDFIGIEQSRAILQRLQSQWSEREKLSGFGSLSLTSADRKGAAQSILQLVWPEQFRLEFQDPIGGKLFLLQFDKNFLWVEDPKKPESTLVATGSKEGLEQAKKLFGLGDFGAHHFAVWMQMFLARPDLTNFLVDIDDPKILRKFEDGTLREEIHLASDGEISQWRIFQAGGAHAEQILIEYEDYKTKGGLTVPQILRLEIVAGARKGARLIWRWQDWEPNAGREDRLQLPPRGAKDYRRLP